MEHWLWIILAALFFECKGQDTVTQPSGDVIATEGDTVTLNCTFQTSVYSNAYLFWYKQEVNSYPNYMLRCFSATTDKAAEFNNDRFDAKINGTSVPLKIQKLQLSDSAVYYCALRPNTGTYKIIFGRGTRLNTEPREKYEPDYYKVGEGSSTACLATDFSRHNATINHSSYGKNFSYTPAVRISPQFDLYNQVMFPDDKGIDCEQNTKNTTCEDTLEPDPKVNLVSLTILGLRVIFIKTIIFNILMTLRLWLSR